MLHCVMDKPGGTVLSPKRIKTSQQEAAYSVLMSALRKLLVLNLGRIGFEGLVILPHWVLRPQAVTQKGLQGINWVVSGK